MNILLINQAFYPDIVATAQLMTDWTRHLTSQGHQVTVIASRSVYGQSKATLPKRETLDGIHIHRLPGNLFKKGGLLTRAIDWGLFQFLAFFKALTLPRPDVVVCLTTPPFLGVIGRTLQLLKNSRYVQYEMDVYPDISIALGVMKPHSPAARLFESLHRHTLQKADRIIVLGRCMARIIAAKGIPESKLTLVTPWSDPDEIIPLPRSQNPFLIEHNLTSKFVVMYSGNLGLGHDIATLLQAMQQLHQKTLPTDADIQFVFIGGGRRMQEIQAFTQSHNLPTPLMLDYQPRHLLSQTLSAADLHLITQGPNTTGLIIPSKFYGILAAGRPSLYIGPPDTEIALAIAEHQLGQVLTIGDTPALLAALRHYQSHPDPVQEQKIRHISRTLYSRQICCEKLTQTLEQLNR